MSLLRTSCVALLAAFALAPQAEAIVPCVNAFVNFMPAHPGPADVITWSNPLGLRDTAPQVVKTTVSPGLIVLDIRSAGDPAATSGYVAVGPWPYMGLIGPLPVGEYSVTVSLSGSCDTLQTILTVSAQSAATATAPVVEFHNAALDQFFNTQNASQIYDLDTGVHPGWTRTGQGFLAYLPGQSDGRGLNAQKFYGRPEAGLNSHFLTWMPSEEDALRYLPPFDSDWIFEDDNAFEIPVPLTTTGACPAETIPVYRLWNHRPDTGHRYTADKVTRQQMVDAGYIAEGFGADTTFMCAVLP